MNGGPQKYSNKIHMSKVLCDEMNFQEHYVDDSFNISINNEVNSSTIYYSDSEDNMCEECVET